jgi:hypothetical protein
MRAEMLETARATRKSALEPTLSKRSDVAAELSFIR